MHSASPPLPPSLSRKRILPAFLLCFAVGFFGLHRVYLGKHWSGGFQFAATAVGFFWLEQSCAGLLALTNLEDVQAWVEIHGAPLGPLFFVALAGLAPVFDCVRLAAGKFRDARGNLVTEWT